MSAAARITCCVPFCRRWHRGNGGDWICWDHWKRIPLARRRAYFRAVAERVPEWLDERGKVPRWMLARPPRTKAGARPRSIRAVWRLWGRLKREAIERAL